VTQADGSDEGDSPAVEKFEPRGVGERMNWRGTILTLVGVAAAVPVCAPAFVLGAVLVPLRRFVPVCVAPGCLLPLAPIRGVCARLKGTVATHIAITPSLIKVI